MILPRKRRLLITLVRILESVLIVSLKRSWVGLSLRQRRTHRLLWSFCAVRRASAKVTSKSSRVSKFMRGDCLEIKRECRRRSACSRVPGLLHIEFYLKAVPFIGATEDAPVCPCQSVVINRSTIDWSDVYSVLLIRAWTVQGVEIVNFRLLYKVHAGSNSVPRPICVVHSISPRIRRECVGEHPVDRPIPNPLILIEVALGMGSQWHCQRCQGQRECQDCRAGRRNHASRGSPRSCQESEPMSE